jgi:hypothetical protein
MLMLLASILAVSDELIAAGRFQFPESVREIPMVSRSAVPLSRKEMNALMQFSIALKMRNVEELQARVERGEVIPRDTMGTLYDPLQQHVAALRRWLVAQGLHLSTAEPGGLGIHVSGSLRQIEQALQVHFVRVVKDGKESFSVANAPSLPLAIAAPVLSINGLQPHLHPHAGSARLRDPPASNP